MDGAEMETREDNMHRCQRNAEKRRRGSRARDTQKLAALLTEDEQEANKEYGNYESVGCSTVTLTASRRLAYVPLAEMLAGVDVR
jgi:hypothetical protein